jgi:hypothetical protein
MTSDARHRLLAVAHHHPGRLRVRSRAFEGDEALRASTERWLTEQPGVIAARSEAATGSILVAYEPSRVDAGELLAAMAGRAQLAVTAPSRSRLRAQAVFDAARALDETVVKWSGGRLGLGVAVPVALGIGSIASLFLSPHVRAPRWDNLLYWGVHFFRTLNDDQNVRGREHARGG